ncbi:MAG: TrbC/VirB2 family protein [Treponema sp.]|uniref:TrbC/VirB2 family protein n=1 Tax=Treponema sp. TaxID=166 RepID=UPI0025D9349B|nr:TrbC/VirB2 family protein [Treponema sp.]MBQ8678341.1 TrbC/VirB2 family protein [Treponema sp.]
MKSILKIAAKKGSSLLKSFKGFVFSKPFVMFALLSCVMISGTFAATDSIDVLDSWSDKILDLLSSSWVKVLCLVALIIEAIGVVVSGQQGGGGQIIKRFAPWIIGTLILLCASGICSYFLSDLEFEVSLLLPGSSAVTSIA